MRNGDVMGLMECNDKLVWHACVCGGGARLLL